MIDRHSSTSPSLSPSWWLAGIVVVFITYGLIFFWYAVDRAPDILGPVLTGAWVIQAHLFATWAALRPGKLLLRLPPIVATFLTVLGAPAVHPNGQFERGEFVALALTGTSIFAITTVLLLIVRRFVGWRIEQPESSLQSDYLRYRFSTWYLIALITLCAVALGIYTNLVFEPPAPSILFGPGFVIAIIVYGGATMAVLLWPIIAVPLFVLIQRRSKRGVFAASMFWAIITAGVIIFWHVVDDNGVDILLAAILLQGGAALMGCLAAFALRLAGFRLVRRQGA